jgi:tetraacyldisaccharide 4'-kinase
MKSAPSWWWRPGPSLARALLWPLALIWGSLVAYRLRRPQIQGPCPVICVGNFTVGGAGKTPVVAYLFDFLSRRGMKPVILSRGYGGTLPDQESFWVDTKVNTAFEVGDEPWLLAQKAAVVIGADRRRSAQLACAYGVDIVILDDGLQNTTLKKDLSFVVVDGVVGIGNGACLPSGPLRAPLKSQWPHVSCLVIMGEAKAPSVKMLVDEAVMRHIPVLRAHVTPVAADMDAIRGKKLIAFAGLGRPEKFFDMLRQKGEEIVEARPYPDHHWFTTEDLDELAELARLEQAILVTTQKDAVRIDASEWVDRGVTCIVIGIYLEWEDNIQAEAYILEQLEHLKNMVL